MRIQHRKGIGLDALCHPTRSRCLKHPVSRSNSIILSPNTHVNFPQPVVQPAEKEVRKKWRLVGRRWCRRGAVERERGGAGDKKNVSFGDVLSVSASFGFFAKKRRPRGTKAILRRYKSKFERGMLGNWNSRTQERQHYRSCQSFQIS